MQFANPWEGALLVGTTDEPYEGDPRDARGRRDADIEQIVRESRASIEPGRRRARPHPLELRRRARAAAGRGRDAVGAPRDGVRARRRAACSRSRAASSRRSGASRSTRSSGCAATSICGRSTARPAPLPGAADPGGGRRAAAARPPVAGGGERAAPRALPRQRRARAARARARAIRRCSSRSRPGAPEVAAQVRWAREREWALTADDVLARRTTLAALGRAEAARGARRGAAAMSARYVAALDQGTTSTPLPAVRPRAGARSRAPSTSTARSRRARAGSSTTPTRSWRARAPASTRRWPAPARAPADVAAIGIANQRETVVLWERESGRPLANAIVWQDTRSAERVAALGALDRFRAQTGLPLATYFSGPKLSWLLDELPGARARAEAGELAAGTIDSWLAWHLAGVHVTDATNASRTLLMDLAHARLGRRPARRDRRAARAAGRDRAVERRRRRDRRHAARRAARRPAGGALRAVLLRAGRGQVHLRHGQLPRAQHRRARRALEPRADHRRRLPARRRAAGVHARGLDRRHRARSCSGCATTSG